MNRSSIIISQGFWFVELNMITDNLKNINHRFSWKSPIFLITYTVITHKTTVIFLDYPTWMMPSRRWPNELADAEGTYFHVFQFKASIYLTLVICLDFNDVKSYNNSSLNRCEHVYSYIKVCCISMKTYESSYRYCQSLWFRFPKQTSEKDTSDTHRTSQETAEHHGWILLSSTPRAVIDFMQLYII